jgi:protocatechuate 3,4-dioxygenase beta subunit
MQRRTFLRDATISAIAVTATGFIKFDGSRFVGDCETTTDILGPFYRPGSPVRTNLLVAGEPGTKILLTGAVRHSDCVTPFGKAKIELWHCSSAGEYDNHTDEFKYRGTTYSDNNGKYFFNTIVPVPYGIGNDVYRPAHFHLMISAENYQPLVTQLYFSGDPHISKDPSSASATAKRRILDVKTLPDKSKKVLFDISLSKKLSPEITSIDRLAGVYEFEQDHKKIQFFRNGNALWIKNDVFGEDLEYIGNNTFRYPGLEYEDTYTFTLQGNGKIKLELISPDTNGQKKISTAFKEL